MPIINPEDAEQLDKHLRQFFSAAPNDKTAILRQMFVEEMDFEPLTGAVSLQPSPQNVTLSESADLIARAEGFTVVFVQLGTPSNRVRNAEVVHAAKRVEEQLGADMVLAVLNSVGDQLHLVHPTFETATPTLRRMVIEKNLPRRTAVQQLSNCYYRWQERTLREALSEAYNVEAVTSRFFDSYRGVFADVESAVTGFESQNSEELRQFTQTLFNRLMFIYFVSRKGWLEFDGKNDYLDSLWQSHQSTENNRSFYVSRLLPLFFDGLNNPSTAGSNNPVIGNVPFLNGGLFDQTESELELDIDVPDSAISLILGPSGLFNRFNFTVMESTPYDVEVAIDPEMLGKVFEELVTDRHSSGAYYTPRPVVSFMCREAIKGYLNGGSSGASPNSISRFVDARDPSELGLEAASEIGRALRDIRIVDPACGSGAYLLGMLQELLDLSVALFSPELRDDARTNYETKLHIIERNLYGADVDEFAVNIAMLRLWLSLAIEFDGSTPPPLPNLDFKIVCGDSLTGASPTDPGQLGLFGQQSDQVASRMAEAKDRFLESWGDEKEQARVEVERLELELEQLQSYSDIPDDAVDWRVQFGEVYGTRGGFDAVLANPPYVRNEDIGPTKSRLRRLYGSALTGRSDLYAYFWIRSIELLREGGTQVFVCSNTWMDSVFGVPLQTYMVDNGRLELVLESQIERQFSTAAVNTAITVFHKGSSSSDDCTSFVSLYQPFAVTEQGIHGNLDGIEEPDSTAVKNRKITRSALKDDLDRADNYGSPTNLGGRYLRAPDAYTLAWNGAAKSGKSLATYATGERYLNTGGADGFFVLTHVDLLENGVSRIRNLSKEGLADGTPTFDLETEFLNAGIRATDLDRLLVSDPDMYVVSIPPDTDLSNRLINEYISWGESVGFDAKSVTRTQKPWWRPSRQAVNGASLLWPRTHSESHRCFYNPNKLISLRFFRLHPIEDDLTLPILAVLNSSIFALFKEIHGRRGLGQGALETGLVDILPLPFPDLSDETSEQLTSAIEPILNRDIGSFAQEANSEDRRALDQITLNAFGIDDLSIDDIYLAVNGLIDARIKRSKTLAV